MERGKRSRYPAVAGEPAPHLVDETEDRTLDGDVIVQRLAHPLGGVGGSARRKLAETVGSRANRNSP